MRSIIKMSFSNIKRKKLQSLLIGVIILAAALIFTTALGTLAGIKSPYEQMHKKLNASHLLLVFDKKMHEPEKVAAFWKSQKEVSSVTSVSSCVRVESPLMDNKKLDIQFFMSEMGESSKRQDKLIVVEGERKTAPGVDEMWIPTALAYSQKLKVGDKLDIPLPDGKKSLKISAIVVDPIFSTNMINPTRIWVREGALKGWYPEKSLGMVFMGVRYKSLVYEKELWERFGKTLDKPFSGIKFTYSLVSMAFLMMYQLIGIMLLLFSVILLLIALYILSASIKDAVISDYKTIGILKSHGFTPGNVVFIYTFQMILISVAAIPLGVLLSTLTIRQVLSSLLKALGMVDINMSLGLIFAMAFLILIALISVSALLSARRAGRVKPTEAIRYGAPAEDLLVKQSRLGRLLRRLPVVSYIGANQLLASKRQIVFSFLTFCATVFVLVIGINSYNSMDKLADNSAVVGFDDSDVTITVKDRIIELNIAKMQERILKDTRVSSVLPSSWLLTGVIPEDSEHAAFNIIGTSYDGNMDKMGYLNVEGKNPVKDDEISIATNTAKTYDKNPGDNINIFIEGKELNLKVTGIYQSFNNLGQGYRVQTGAVKKANPEYTPNLFLVTLKNNKDIDDFISAMNKEFGLSVDVVKTKDTYSRVMKPIVSNMGMAIILINFVFVIVLLLTIFSSSLLSIHKQKKNFGIFKTIGLTPVQVRLSIVVRYLLLGAIAIIVGLAAGLFITPLLMTAMCSGMGVVNFPMTVNLVQTMAVIPFVLLLAFICSWIPSGQITKISSRTLVSE